MNTNFIHIFDIGQKPKVYAILLKHAPETGCTLKFFLFDCVLYMNDILCA